MKEKLYTIPVIDGFQTDCECPICTMRDSLEADAIDFTMGPSYMEDDVRAVTDEVGFCEKHIQMLYKNQNRLGLALMLHTHMKKTIEELEHLTQTSNQTAKSFFKKKPASSNLTCYIQKLEQSCFICNRMNQTLERYFVTIFHLYKTEPDFVKKFQTCRGFCTKHYGILYDLAPNYLSGTFLEQFLHDLHSIYFENMKRVRDDLDWFIDKFDYRNADKPWKTSQDALPRTIIKTNSVTALE